MNFAIVPVIIILIAMVSSPNDNDKQKSSFIKQQDISSSSLNHKKLHYITDLKKQASNSLELEKNKLEIKFESIEDEKNFFVVNDFIKNQNPKLDPKERELIALYIVKYSKNYDIDPKVTAALIARESSFNRNAISKTGAKGLGQIKEFNYEDLSISNPFNIKENINGTVLYLHKMRQKWSQKKNQLEHHKQNKNDIYYALASYYKGFTAVKNSKEMLDSQTKGYISDILTNYNKINQK